MKKTITQFLATKKALIAFNIQNIYQLNALHAVSQNKQVPVIAQFSSKYIPYFDETFGLKRLVEKYQNDLFFFHLDHCLDEKLIRFCVTAGFASVMYDGSSLPVEQNIINTNAIYEFASKNGSLLEAELGSISGVEDGFGSDMGDYYSITELDKFNAGANFDMLALAIGNAHGIYSSTEEIKVKKLLEARELIGQKLFVLHGGTGMPDEMINEAISYGVIKINVSTALKYEYMKIVNSYCAENKSYDELKFNQYITVKLAPFYESYLLKFSI